MTDFATGAGDLAQVLELVQVLLDEYLAHAAASFAAMYLKARNLASTMHTARAPFFASAALTA